jgi:hypothetical protein
MVKYGPILKRVFIKCHAKLDFFQNGQEKNSTRQIPVISGKNQNHKNQFSDESCSVAPQELEKKNVCLKLAFKKNLTT